MRRSLAFSTPVLGAALAGRPAELPASGIPASSKLGGRVLSSARRLDDNKNMGWLPNYSIQFQKCATSDEYFGGFGGEGGGGGDRNNYYGMYEQRLVHFKLCPSDDCGNDRGSCAYGADYVIDMNLFVEAYIESKLEAQEYNCEMVREYCDCENANDEDACEMMCYYDAGLDYCQDRDQGNNGQNGQQFELEEAAECHDLDVDDEALQWYYYNEGGNNQNQYYGNGNGNGEIKLFVGPYCSADGKSIYLGTFMDEMCSFEAPSGTYEKFFYGQELPYSSESLIDDGCVSCKEPQDANDNNNGDQNDEDEVLEVCERLYEDAGKCESGLADGVTYYPNTYACDFIETLHAPGKSKSGRTHTVSASRVFAGLFAATTAIFAGVSFHLYKKSTRQNVQLSRRDGTLA